MMSRASWKRAAAQRAGGTGLLIIIRRTVSDAHDRARINVARAKVRARVFVRACVHTCDTRTTGYELAQLQLAKSSEPFITLMPTLILNRRHELPGAAQKPRARLFVSPSQKIYEQSAFACHAADTPDHSESFRHASRVTRFVLTHLFFTFSPIESCYNTARYHCEMSRHCKSFSL